jgi:hypothetical protein
MSSSPDESSQTTSKSAHVLDPESPTERGPTLEEVLALEAT